MFSLTGFFRKSSSSSPIMVPPSTLPSSPSPSAPPSPSSPSLSGMLKSIDKDPKRLVENLSLLLGGGGELEEVENDDYKSIPLIIDHLRNILVSGIIGIPLPATSPIDSQKSIQLQHKKHCEFALIACDLACETFLNSSLLLLLSKGDILERLEFESRQQIVTIINCLIRRKSLGTLPTIIWLTEDSSRSFTFISNLINSYSKGTDVSLSSGLILREALRMESLTAVLLKNDCLFEKLTSFLNFESFDVSSDAFATIKECLTRHRAIVAIFLEEKYSFFMNIFLPFLESTNYITKRQSLKLLGELLLDRCNFETMIIFIGKGKNLKQIMNLLRDTSKTIQGEAWHIFKIFIANPAKTPSVMGILSKNKERLLIFLSTFYPFKDVEGCQNARESENLLKRQFIEERIFLIGEIEKIQSAENN